LGLRAITLHRLAEIKRFLQHHKDFRVCAMRNLRRLSSIPNRQEQSGASRVIARLPQINADRKGREAYERSKSFEFDRSDHAVHG
jgi:hypothetical protein